MCVGFFKNIQFRQAAISGSGLPCNGWAAYAGCPFFSGNLRKIASYIGVGEKDENKQ